MSFLSDVQQALAIYAQIKLARLSIKDAPVGGVVDCGTARGVRVFGRVLDIPLQPVVRK